MTRPAEPSPAALNALGRTRSRVAARHAVLAPDGRVFAPLPGWSGARAATLVSPQLGTGVSARFAMHLVEAGVDAAGNETGGCASGPPLPGVERFAFVLDGEVRLHAGDAARPGGGRTGERLAAGGYAYLPAGLEHRLESGGPARLLLFERRWLPADAPPPERVVGRLDEVAGEPFLGDDGVTVRLLLPSEPGFDMGMNVMSFRPGASLPFVETHANEHGMWMLTGGGIYRLEDDWYPLTAEDALWMGPYCPQWFGALGREEASYLLYKDLGRDWLASEPAG